MEGFWTPLALVAVLTAVGTSGFRGVSRGIVFEERGNAFNGSSEFRVEQNTDVFPSEMFFDMTMEGVGTVDLHLVRDRFMNAPHKWADSGASKMVDLGYSTTRTSFYTDASGYGSFACMSYTTSGGNTGCKMAALLDLGDETCYIAPGSSEAECTVQESGILELYEELSDGGRKLIDTAEVRGGDVNTFQRFRRSTNEAIARRQKRSIFPTVGYQVIEIAYVGDKTFMQSFYDRHPGDNKAAQDEATLFVTLMTNEMNVYYATIKEVSNGALDLYLYPADLVFPEVGDDFQFIKDAYDGRYLQGNRQLDTDIETYINSGFTDKTWDHTFVITGYNLHGSSSGTIGYAYSGTVCNQESTKKFSINEFRDYNIGRLGAHEIGHALAMSHDISTECPAGKTIMSSYLFSICSSTLDTFYKFSTCSVRQVIAHLDSNTDCSNQHGFTDAQFKETFCSGLPGAQDGWLTMQCQKQTGWTGSTPCNTPVNDQDCYRPYEISCRNSDNSCSSIRYVWQGTSCGTDKFCYQGRCVNSFEICEATVPCTCCGIERNRRRRKCCRRGRRRNNTACYCCGHLRNTNPPVWWSGPTY